VNRAQAWWERRGAGVVTAAPMPRVQLPAEREAYAFASSGEPSRQR
jgi:hypothetical protein